MRKNEQVRAFRFGLENDYSLHPRNEIIEKAAPNFDGSEPSIDSCTGMSLSETAKQLAASQLFESGTFKTDPEFDVCWEKAWFRAQREARTQTAICIANLRDYVELSSLPDLPQKPWTGEEGRRISVFALSLLRVKITKDFEKAADGNGRQMRHAHASLWEKEAIRVNGEFKGALKNMESLGDGNNSLPEATEIPMGLLKVHRVMTVSEVEKLEGF